MAHSILIVEDEPDLRELLSFSLERMGFVVRAAADGRSAWEAIIAEAPELIVLDWMLPDISGIELLRRLRKEPTLADVPVIMLTARGEEADRVRGLDSGADDYVTKPFSMNELGARIRARLRRRDEIGTERIEYGGVVLDTGSHRVMVGDDPVKLGPTEFRLLHHFLKRPDRVFSRSQLLDGVWGTNVYAEERTMDVHIRRLRKALPPRATRLADPDRARRRLPTEHRRLKRNGRDFVRDPSVA